MGEAHPPYSAAVYHLRSIYHLPKADIITSDTLGEAFEPEERFENPDGSDIIFDCDINGIKRGSSLIPGPWADKDCEFIY